jgi:hypothetical protein
MKRRALDSSWLLLAASAACAPAAGKPLGPPEGSFEVSDYFAPSGAMGDGEMAENLIIDDASNCKPRPEGAAGHCYHFEYHAGPLLWSGIYFQYPANNWGAQPGLAIPPSLERLSFQAAIVGEPDVVTFVAGGIGIPAPALGAQPFVDPFRAQLDVTLTAEYQRVEIPIALPASGTAEGPRLIGALGWFMNHRAGSDPSAAPIKTLYLDDLVYEAE